MGNWDPVLYDRIGGTIKVPSFCVQIEFAVPEAIRETLTVKELRQCHGVHVVEFDLLPQIGGTIEYPNSTTCPIFEWKIVEVRSIPRRWKSRQPRVLSRLIVKFIGLMEG